MQLDSRKGVLYMHPVLHLLEGSYIISLKSKNSGIYVCIYKTPFASPVT